MRHSLQAAATRPTSSWWVPLATDRRDQFYARVTKEAPRMAESPEARIFTHTILDSLPVKGRRAAL